MKRPKPFYGISTKSSLVSSMLAVAVFVGAVLWSVGPAFGQAGQWPMPRHDKALSGHAPGKAAMTKAPARVATYDHGQARPAWVFAKDLDGDEKAEIVYPDFDDFNAPQEIHNGKKD